jgi:hypothetical protein
MNEEVLVSIDRWMGAEGNLRRVGEARRKAAAEKIAKERGWKPNDTRLLFVLLPRSPGEGRIVRGPEGCTFRMAYTPEMIAEVEKKRPWLLEGLLKELDGGPK